MRRADREIKDQQKLKEILKQAQAVRVGYQDSGGMAIVPLNYGFVWEGELPVLYIHSALEGRKVSAFSRGGSVAIELDCGCQVVESGQACGYSCRYRSIMGSGEVRLLEGREEKVRGLNAIMEHYSSRGWEFPPEAVERVAVFAIQVTSLSGKEHD